MKSYDVRLDAQLARVVEQLARKAGMSAEDLIAEAVRAQTFSYRYPALGEGSVVHAPAPD